MKQNQRTNWRAAILRAIATVGACAAAAASYAQWTVVDLTPAGATSASAHGVYGGQQAGTANFGSGPHAGLWSGTSASWVDINPAGATASGIVGVSGGQEAGSANFGGGYHPGLWSGTAGSWVDLSVPGAWFSQVNGVGDGQQVGYAASFNGGPYHAILWTGTAASSVDLNPAGAIQSFAWGVSGGQQVGRATTATSSHACIWSGTAATWVDINPAGSTDSNALATDGSSQVGVATIGGAGHASLWSGTAASWVDLNPAGATASNCGGVYRGQQVGYAEIGGAGYLYRHASYWSGSAGSWVDLQAYLPSNISYSGASGVWQDASGITYVVGSGTDSITGLSHAYMWVLSPVGPPPYTLSVQSQNPTSGVSVTVNDDSGSSSVSTPYDIVYNTAGVQASLTAPQTSPTGTTFLYWSEDGTALTAGQTTLQLTMNSNHTATAVYGSPYTLSVQSQNPASGVSVTVSPNDNNGIGSGSTSFSLTYNPGAQVSVTAPTTSSTGATFLHWTEDGTALTAGQATVQVTMTANHTMDAVYGYTLTVQSQLPSSGVSVTVSPSDANGNGNGLTQFTRVYLSGTATLTAPSKASGNSFKYWILDGARQASGRKTLNVGMGANHTAVAVY
ncbi:MAG: hypothetical protein ACHQ50_02145 [Fimbriimonadales bacterium]